MNPLIIGDYAVQNIIHEGSSTVFTAMHVIKDIPVVIKALPITTIGQQKAFTKELNLTSRASSSDSSVHLYEYFISNDVAYLVQERHVMDLLCFIETYQVSTQMKKEIFVKVCAAVADCHRNGIVHLDLKPENILIGFQSELEVYLCDYGSAEEIGEEIRRVVGTKLYRDPSLHIGTKANTYADIWSLGIILHALVTETFPYTEDSLQTGESLKNILESSGICPNLISLIVSILELQPKQRPSLENIAKHEWLTQQEDGDEMMIENDV